MKLKEALGLENDLTPSQISFLERAVEGKYYEWTMSPGATELVKGDQFWTKQLRGRPVMSREEYEAMLSLEQLGLVYVEMEDQHPAGYKVSITFDGKDRLQTLRNRI